MRTVIGMVAEQRLVLKKASRHCKSDIHYRQSETQNRHGYAHDGRPSAPAVQGERSEREADEQASRVAHKNACRMEIENHKTEYSAKKSASKHGHKIVVPH